MIREAILDLRQILVEALVRALTDRVETEVADIELTEIYESISVTIKFTRAGKKVLGADSLTFNIDADKHAGE